MGFVIAAWPCHGVLQQQWPSVDCPCTWMCDGWLWAICPRTSDYTFLSYELLWYVAGFRPQISCYLNVCFVMSMHFLIGTANNAGAILVLGRDLVVVPKLIHPLPPAISSPETSPERHIEDTWMQVLLQICSLEDFYIIYYTYPVHMSTPKKCRCFRELFWYRALFTLLFPYLHGQELNANRPPTPTRGRPQVANDRGSLAWI